MKAVFRHELFSAFTGLTAYVFGGFVLLFTGIYTMAYNLKGGYANFEYVLGSMSFVFLIIVPILTMRVLAEERHQKTDQLLYSLPLTMTQVVMGKFFALAAVFLAPVAVMGLYPLVLSAYGNINLAASYTSLAGFYFLGCALISLGVYISSVTESQAVAAGLCFVVMLINYFVGDLCSMVSTEAYASLVSLAVVFLALSFVVYYMTKSGLGATILAALLEGGLLAAYLADASAFEGLFPNLIGKMSLFERFYDLVNGIFDLGTIVYYLSVMAVFLFLTVQSLEKRRWSE